MDDEVPPQRQAQLRAAATASGLGCSVVVSLGLMIGLGVYLDQRFDTTPILTLVGVVLGIGAAGYEFMALVRAVEELERGRSARSVGEQPPREDSR